jgi:nitroreductase
VDLWEAIRGRRSVRRFTDRAVGSSTLERLVEAAVWAPSGGNAQTWRFAIVADAAVIRKLKTVSPGLLGDPPAVVAVCQDLVEARRRGGTLGETFLAVADAAMATQNLLLAAHAEGLGTCVVASFHRGAVVRLLGLGPGVEPILLVSVGWPAETPPPPPRRTGAVAFVGVVDRGD